MLKVFVCIAVVVFATYCGYFLAKKYRKRKDFFNRLFAFNDAFLNEISYHKRPLKEFLKCYRQKGDFAVFSTLYLRGLGDENLYADSHAALTEMGCFSNEEMQFILEYFSMLGKGDSQGQKQYYAGIKNRLNEYMDKAKTDYEKYGKLYVKLGFLCGLTILILII